MFILLSDTGYECLIYGNFNSYQSAYSKARKLNLKNALVIKANQLSEYVSIEN